ncbi:class I SAM-dependent methyltransferase [Patescibacteria group bacterium]
MKLLMKWINETVGFPLRSKYLVKFLYPYLKNTNKVLDLGSSSGRLAKDLSKYLPNVNFVGVDTHVPSKTFIPVKKYDGKRLPFPNNSFDCVMMIDVLHHSNNPEMIIKEAKRVSRKFVLIKDHYWKNKLDFLLLKFADYIGNKPYGIPLPYNFLKITNWKKIIKNTKLKITKSQKFHLCFLDFCNHIIYLLKK